MSSRTTLQYREVRPSAALRPYVECLWMVWDPKPRTERALEHIVPDASPEIIVHLAEPFARRVGTRWIRQPRAFLAGTLSRPWVLRPGRRVRTLGMRFRPGALTALFPCDMRLATDREVALPAIAGSAASRACLAALQRTTTRERCFRSAESWLASRLPAQPRTGLTHDAVSMILAARGQQRIAAIAAALMVHPRRLERAFGRDLGIRPKLFARIVRLNVALAALDGRDRERAVDLALDAGYFDQAHMARDFRIVAGRGVRGGAAGEMAPHFIQRDRLLGFLAGE
jgi:methylphosphotriester-DNA--protein-cysteine methyltransferase